MPTSRARTAALLAAAVLISGFLQPRSAAATSFASWPVWFCTAVAAPPPTATAAHAFDQRVEDLSWSRCTGNYDPTYLALKTTRGALGLCRLHGRRFTSEETEDPQSDSFFADGRLEGRFAATIHGEWNTWPAYLALRPADPCSSEYDFETWFQAQSYAEIDPRIGDRTFARLQAYARTHGRGEICAAAVTLGPFGLWRQYRTMRCGWGEGARMEIIDLFGRLRAAPAWLSTNAYAVEPRPVYETDY